VVGGSIQDILDTPQVLALSVHRDLGPAFAYLRTTFPASSNHPSTSSPLYTDDLHGHVTSAVGAAGSGAAGAGSSRGGSDATWAALCNGAGRLRLGVLIGMAYGACVWCKLNVWGTIGAAVSMWTVGPVWAHPVWMALAMLLPISCPSHARCPALLLALMLALYVLLHPPLTPALPHCAPTCSQAWTSWWET
jgi:hypothetical protein